MKFIAALAAVFLGSTSLVAGQSIIEAGTNAGFNILVDLIEFTGLTSTFDGSEAGDFSKYSY